MAYISFQPSDFFNTVLYTGNGTNDTPITGVGFQPDWVWLKNRTSAGSSHLLADSNRGASQRLRSDTTDAEDANGISSFDTDGFTLTSGGNQNSSGANYVAWNWKSNGGTTSSNTDGSITSTVQANTTSGFSVVTWTGTGANATVGHGLGVAPKLIINKNRSLGTGDWVTYHNSIGATKYLQLNQTAAAGTSIIAFNNTEPTSSVFSVGTWDSANGNGNNMVSYCFADIKGFSSFGTYTGNGSTDGTFVYTGFRPAFLIIKRIDTTASWFLYDNKRDPYNEANASGLYPNLSNAEFSGTSNVWDFTSNGFKGRASTSDTNASGGSYVYMAFAQFPFVTSTARPGTAR